MKYLVLISLALHLSFNSWSQLTYVPDDAFEAYIETTFPSANNGSANDNYVLTAGIQNVYNVGIDGAYYQVNDYTGLQDFTIMVSINIINQNVPIIDLSSYPNVNPLLGHLGVFIEGNNLLQTVILPQNKIYLGIADNSSLENIIFQDNNILSWISTVSDNSILEYFDISNTAGVEMGALITIANHPMLKCINLKNGGFANWEQVGISLNGLINTDPISSILTCVEVDNPTYSQNSSSWNWDFNDIDPSTYSYSTNCSCSLDLLENKITSINTFPNPASDEVHITFPETSIGGDFMIIDEIGKVVQIGIVTDTNFTLETNNFENGVYYINVGSKNHGRFIILR
jgi:hypothetical protein